MTGRPPVDGTISIADGADTVTTTTVHLTDLTAVDLLSGLGPGALMRFSNDGSQWSTPEPYDTVRKRLGSDAVRWSG